MHWTQASLVLFGGLVAVMGLGLPVAFAFLAINVLGAAIFLGGEPGLAQLARNAVQSITSFALTPIPFFVLIGGIVPGLMLSAIFVGYIIVRAVINPELAPSEPLDDALAPAQRWRPFLVHVLPLIAIFAL